MPEEQSGAIESAARLMVESDYVIALVGSGLSVDSGVPTFRGPGGLWTKVGEPSMRGYEEFLEDPAEWRRRQSEPENDPARAEFRQAIDRAEPNTGHRAMAGLERLGVLKMAITQNIDNLHTLAGSLLVTEIHGNRTKLRCIGCESRWVREEFEVLDYPPVCPGCGGLVKGDTMMFGEPIPRKVLDDCWREVGRSDCMIVVGTSATVYPAAGFPEMVKQRGGCLIEANPNETPLSSISDVVLRGPTSDTLPAVVSSVEAMMRS